ncbi:MAG: amino acid permease [Gammaproteobacteria bacterium]|nr:amino acid permease [Gammaproteobacteria bacterium]
MSEPAATMDAGKGDLPRRLGFATATAAVMGAIIGSGIFRVPAEIGALVGSPSAMILVWVLGGLATLCVALSMAELAAMFPRAGGSYVFIREAWGPGAAFVFGWTYLLINPAGWAGISMVFAEYAGKLIGLEPQNVRWLAVAAIVVVMAANYRSVWLGAALQNIATFAKVTAIVALALFLFILGEPAVDVVVAGAAAPQSLTLPGLLTALVAVLWAYDGSVQACSMSGEIRDPQRNVPRALIVGVGAVMTIYVLVNLAYLYVLPFVTIVASPLVAAAAAEKVFGDAGSALITALVMVSTFGTLAVVVMADPRVFFAMSRDRNFFEPIGKVHARFQTPHIAILMHGALAIAYVSIRSFEELAAIFILGVMPLYALAVAGVLRLRVTRPELPRPYCTFGYPYVPIVFVAAVALILGNSLIETPGITGINLLITLSGVPVYFAWRAFSRRA